jgi:hypothetical protein
VPQASNNEIRYTINHINRLMNDINVLSTPGSDEFGEKIEQLDKVATSVTKQLQKS